MLSCVEHEKRFITSVPGVSFIFLGKDVAHESLNFDRQ